MSRAPHIRIGSEGKIKVTAFGCPVCNGLREANVHCRLCGNPMNDTGRLEDAFDNYSPYREIDDLRKTNGYWDLQAKQCMHIFVCGRCGHSETLGIPEQILG